MMSCRRCQGTLVSDTAVVRVNGREAFEMFRCIQCGNVEDSVILRNRGVVLSDEEVRKGGCPRQHGYVAQKGRRSLVYESGGKVPGM